MRKEFAEELYKHMQKDKRIWLLTGDLGYGMWDKIRDDLPDRFINTGAAEQAMMGIACGLAMEGKIPVVYSITPFLLYRPFEVWRTYINHEIIHVIGIGSGRNDDYKHDGFSHYAGDDIEFMRPLKNVTSRWPTSILQMKHQLDNAIKFNQPWYINLKR